MKWYARSNRLLKLVSLYFDISIDILQNLLFILFPVLEMVKPMTLLVEDLKHSYPYDWRTKTPIITVLSDQWFVDTEKIADLAMVSYPKWSDPH